MEDAEFAKSKLLNRRSHRTSFIFENLILAPALGRPRLVNQR